jgi:hypothetical protein
MMADVFGTAGRGGPVALRQGAHARLRSHDDVPCSLVWWCDTEVLRHRGIGVSPMREHLFMSETRMPRGAAEFSFTPDM